MKRIALFAAALTLAACSAKEEGMPAAETTAAAAAATPEMPAMADSGAMKPDSTKPDTSKH
jgi:hypothetical protein